MPCHAMPVKNTLQVPGTEDVFSYELEIIVELRRLQCSRRPSFWAPMPQYPSKFDHFSHVLKQNSLIFPRKLRIFANFFANISKFALCEVECWT